MNSFITGSHAYGAPTKASDIDLVIMVDSHTKQFLKRHRSNNDEHEDSPVIRFGKLNLIICEDEVEFAYWKTATSMMARDLKLRSKPRDKTQAKKVLDWFRKKLGYEDRSDSGDSFRLRG